ncbi:MAG: hypothetical protein JXB13_10635, partial [Phycisphaerae bacterium]|nr:hypothetical protein [Phycisphaerae bacterium]
MRVQPSGNGIHGVVTQVPCDTPLEWAMVAFCEGPGGFALQRPTPDAPARQFTILGCEPVLTLEADTDADAAALLSRMAETPAGPCEESTIPFFGGWVGYFGYEAGLGMDSIARRRRPARVLPLARFALYDTVVIYDHNSQSWYVGGVDWDGTGGLYRPPLGDRLERAARRLREAPPP